MLLSQIIGQDNVKRHLLEMHSAGRIPHAMLFLGCEGSGALPLAVAFAQYINCTGDKSSGDSCGQCPSCRKYAGLVHPDLHFVFPIIKRKDGSGDSDMFLPEWRAMFAKSPYFSLRQWLDELGGDKQGLISRDDAVAIHQKLSMKSYEADYKVLIMWRPELMNETASNRILKILEEPPARTIFILVSESTADILPTILSRAQVINVPPVDDADIAQAVAGRSSRADSIAHIAAGNYVVAQQLLDGDEASERNLDYFRRMMRAGYGSNVIEMTSLSDELQRESRETIKDMLAYSLRQVRENFVRNLGQPQLTYMRPSEEAFSDKFARFIHLGNAVRLSRVYNQAIAHVEQNGNVRIITMDLMLRLAVLLRLPRP